ncbi:hypothetical protein VNO77_09455 [Canavalia gladiata]|uniref:Rubicon Homology domain-containing protein n=1 Tax=Canavalia gladiata TaxID=3824 RepID=A0AAN9QX14_CANGL
MMNGRGEVGSPDLLDSFPPLRVRKRDGASRHSSDSEFERYCSANSVMGTPSTSMSMCSAITLFHDFSDYDFGSASVDGNNSLENFSLGRGIVDIRNISDRRRNLRYGSSGLEFYGDCSDELAMTALDSSESIGFKETEVSNRNGGEGGGNGMDGFEMEIGEREIEREEEGEEEELSEGDDSMYNYGSDGDGGNETYLSRSVCYRREPEVRSENSLVMNSSVAFGSQDLDAYHKELEVGNENPLFMNSSVAFGSRDLDDFLLQNGPVFGGNDLFHNARERNDRVQEDPVNTGSVSSKSFGQKEEGEDEKNVISVNEEVEENKYIGNSDAIKEVRDGEIPAARGQVKSANVCSTIITESSHGTDCPSSVITQVHHSDKLISCPETSIVKVDEVDLDQLAKEAPHNMGLDVTDGDSIEKGNQYARSEEAIATSEAQLVNSEVDNSKFKFDHFFDNRVDKSSSNPSNHLGNINAKSFESLEEIVPPSSSGMRKTLESSSTSTNLLEKSPVTSKIEDFELNEFYDEVVQEMEEILLESKDSPVARLSMGNNRLLEPQLSMPLRDGGLTASTSSTDDAYLLVQRPRRIDKVEVESKIFRSASSPDVIVKRSVLIQECLQSILHSRFFSSHPKAWIWFLSHQDSYPISPVSNAPMSQSPFTRGENIQNFSTLGKTISLIVEIPPTKSMKQLLEAQHHTCAGCHKHFDDGKTLIWDFVQTFGWGKPRLCEYTGQLFCSSCHTNETAVLPARVLHHWDFTPYPVSQLAKSYLDSIHDQCLSAIDWDWIQFPSRGPQKPMLCVTAVNPFLLSKVPALLHVMNVRKKIGIMLTYVRCPFRRSINKGLGNRRYLLEGNDFFALRDLIDLSKGVFTALPVMVETVSKKILEHITDQCLICCDVGIPCSARQDCSDPSSLIFPFQEDDIERCKACQSVFHKRCFRKLANCPCGAQLRLNERSLTNRRSQRGGGETRGALDLLGRGLNSGLSTRFLSGLFTKEKPEKTREHKDENIILMGSLPSTSL